MKGLISVSLNYSLSNLITNLLCTVYKWKGIIAVASYSCVAVAIAV